MKAGRKPKYNKVITPILVRVGSKEDKAKIKRLERELLDRHSSLKQTEIVA